MKNNITEAHHHRSLCLKGYDYSGEGLYFITICTKDRKHYFGKIVKGEMILNDIGIIAEMFSEEVSGQKTHQNEDVRLFFHVVDRF
jgi:putative transposase